MTDSLSVFALVVALWSPTAVAQPATAPHVGDTLEGQAALAPMDVAAPIFGLAGKCVDDDANRTADGNRIQLYRCNGTPAQVWTYTAGHEIRGPGGKCLDVTNGRAVSGTPVQLFTCNGTAAQRWRWSGSGPVIGLGGLCLDVPSASTSDGTRLQVHTCNGTPAQRWVSLGLGSKKSANKQLGTPGTYANWAWPQGTTALTDIDFYVRVDRDPGPTARVFWSNQFELVPGVGGYLGMQSELDDHGRLFLFSIWSSPGGVVGSPGSVCIPFVEDGTGTSCRIRYAWQVHHTYRFHVAPRSPGLVGVTVTDVDTNDAFDLGSVRVDPSAKTLSANGVSQWTEYFEWNNPRSTCASQPLSQATFWLRANGGSLAPISTSTNTSRTCAGYSRVTLVNGQATETNGIGSSVRGTITAPDGRCLNAAGGIDEDASAILYGCPGRPTDNEAWVLAADGSLRLLGDMCLTAKGTKVGAPVAITSCLPGSLLQKWSDTRGDLMSAASGLCIVPEGGTTSRQPRLVLGDCVGIGWRMPSN